MMLHWSRQEEQVDIAMLIVRYAFQLFRFFVYIMKAKQKIKENDAVSEIALSDEIEPEGLDHDHDASFSSREKSDSEGLDQVRRKTDLII